jgi:hypothetical protein
MIKTILKFTFHAVRIDRLGLLPVLRTILAMSSLDNFPLHLCQTMYTFL